MEQRQCYSHDALQPVLLVRNHTVIWDSDFARNTSEAVERMSHLQPPEWRTAGVLHLIKQLIFSKGKDRNQLSSGKNMCREIHSVSGLL